MPLSQRRGSLRAYHSTVCRLVWNHDLEHDELSAIGRVIATIGGSAGDFEAYVTGPAREEHDRIVEEAEAIGVFGVPTMGFNGELVWGGDRIPLLIDRIRPPETIQAPLGIRRPAQPARLPRPPDGAPG